MSLIGILLLALVAAVCGGAGQRLGGYSAGGCLLAIVLGFLGAVVGLWLTGLLGLPPILEVSIDGKPFPVVWSVVGAALVSVGFGVLARAGAQRKG